MGEDMLFDTFKKTAAGKDAAAVSENADVSP
jgi:hypothetical protein